MSENTPDPMFQYEFSQLATYENGRTPVLLTEAQYRHAKACVNACAGMDTEALESASGKLAVSSSLSMWQSYCDKKMQLEDVIEQRDELAAELTALRLERKMRQMAEKRNAELLKQRDLLLKALKWIYRGEGKPVDVDAAIASVKGGA